MSQYIYLSEDRTKVLNYINISNETDIPFDISSNRVVELKEFEYWDTQSQSVKKVPQPEIDLQLSLNDEIAKVQNRFNLIRQQQNDNYAVVENEVVVKHGTLQKLFPDEQLPIDIATKNVYEVISRKHYDTATQQLEVVAPYFEAGHVYNVKVIELTSTQMDEVKFNELAKTYELAVIQFLNLKVQERNYDSILSACTYDNSTNPTFKAEALACISWRDVVWDYCYSELNKVKLNQRQINTISEFINELPVLVWP